MKIFYISDINLKEKGVLKNHVFEIVRNFKKLGNDVILFLPNQKRSKEDIKIINVLALKKNVLRGISYNFFLFFYLIYYIFIYKPDVIYTRQNMSTFIPAVLSKIFSITYVTEVNGTFEEELKILKKNKLLIFLSNCVEQICYRFANKIITASPSLCIYIKQKYKIKDDKILSIENGANIDLFKPLNKDKLRERLHFNKNYKYIGYSGGLKDWQGIDFIINSIPIVLKKLPNYRLIILGEGPERDNLINITEKLKIKDKIIFIDSVEYKKVPEYINLFDVCICYLTKLKEGKYGTPFKVYEYLACGKPVILSEIEGISELFKDKVVLAKPENSEDLADKIISLIKNRKLREKLGREGREFIVNNHSWENITKRTLEVIETAINSK